MVGGLITPPLVIFRFAVCADQACDGSLEQYAVAAGMITSGICTIINILQLPIPFTQKLLGRQLFLGTGTLTVMGTSFTFLPVFEIAINQMMSEGRSGEKAYGAIVGTSMLCGLIGVLISTVPVSVLQTIFSPLITSITVLLLGITLTGTGMKYWGGGVVCAEMGWKTHEQLNGLEVPLYPSPLCDNGETNLPYGSAEYIGLGFIVLATLIVIEMFGSVFMKNCNVMIALIIGYLVATLSTKDGKSFATADNVSDADFFTFLWVESFPLSLYGPAVIPLMIAYLVTAVEMVGTLSSVYEVSKLDLTSEGYADSVQGGLMSSGVTSILSGLCTGMPNTAYSQNSGVIDITRCASRRAGIASGVWLILLGSFGKVAGIITSIPDCVLGGMTIYLFSSVITTGIGLAGRVDLQDSRNKFIMTFSLAVGVGVSVWPYAFQDRRDSPYTAAFWKCDGCGETMRGIRNGTSLFLSTGYCVGTVIAIVLNTVIPVVETDSGDDDSDSGDIEHSSSFSTQGKELVDEDHSSVT